MSQEKHNRIRTSREYYLTTINNATGQDTYVTHTSIVRNEDDGSGWVACSGQGVLCTKFKIKVLTASGLLTRSATLKATINKRISNINTQISSFLSIAGFLATTCTRGTGCQCGRKYNDRSVSDVNINRNDILGQNGSTCPPLTG